MSSWTSLSVNFRPMSLQGRKKMARYHVSHSGLRKSNLSEEEGAFKAEEGKGSLQTGRTSEGTYRLVAKRVFSGLTTACRLAGCPMSRSPSLVKATTEGVVRPPSAFSRTRGVWPSMTETHELVVPRSIPMTGPLTLPLDMGRERRGEHCLMWQSGARNVRNEGEKPVHDDQLKLRRGAKKVRVG